MNDSVVLLETFLQKWALVFGRKLPDGAVLAWVEMFAGQDTAVLREALEKVTRESDRMPTPAHLWKAIALVKDARGATVQRGEKYCDCKDCGGYGTRTIDYPATDTYPKHSKAVKCNCHPEHAKPDGYGAPSYDKEGRPCTRNPRTGELTYNTVDPLEGRKFLAKMAEVAQRPIDERAKYWEKWVNQAEANRRLGR
jgi:hypothetical protein